jgi:hypothetical protein
MAVHNNPAMMAGGIGIHAANAPQKMGAGNGNESDQIDDTSLASSGPWANDWHILMHVVHEGKSLIHKIGM